MRYFVLTLFISIFIFGKVFGQSENEALPDSSRLIDAPAIDDSLKFASINTIMAKEPVNNEPFVMQKSPATAIILSVIPGLGQFYNEQYFKSVLFLGAGIGLVSGIIWYNNRYIENADIYDKINKIPVDIQTDQNKSDIARYKVTKEFYRDNRDQFAFYLLGVYVLAAVDAYAGAHLFDFNVDDANFALFPGFNTKPDAVTLNLKIQW